MLDEIGEMSPTIQAKFLRVLEGHPFERVGGSEPINVDVRVIAATNRDLEKDVAEGMFPPRFVFPLARAGNLRAGVAQSGRKTFPNWHITFCMRFNAETGRKIRGFGSDAMEQMLRYRWPGNVRELKNVMERAVVLARGESIEMEDLALSKLQTAGDTAEIVPSSANAFEPMSLEELERRHILATLNATSWNKSQTARILGIERSTLDRKIDRYELDVDQPQRGRAGKQG